MQLIKTAVVITKRHRHRQKNNMQLNCLTQSQWLIVSRGPNYNISSSY